MPELPRCAVIIPSFDGARLLSTCLESLFAHPPVACEFEVVVVDDASGDDTAVRFEDYDPRLSVVRRAENGGFAKACNDGAAAAAAGTDHLVFLNNDTIPLAGWLDALVAEVEAAPELGAVGSKLLFPDGTVQHAGIAIGRDRWPHHIYAGMPGNHPAVERPKRTVAVTAACMLVRAPLFAELGGFDTAYRNGYEDIDFCLRLGERGHELGYCPRSVLYHLESVTRWADDSTLHVEHNSRVFAERWHGRIEPDDFEHYFADGMVEVEYGAVFPLRLSVSPLLATVARSVGAEDPLERLLLARTDQVFRLEAAAIRAALREKRAEAPALPSGGTRRAARVTPVRQGSFTTLAGYGPRTRVSLLMPLRDAAADLRATLPTVFEQDAAAELELVAVDSGSSDDTIAVLEEHDATIVSIPPEDFDHGLTRNLAVEHARGDVLVFLNARTRPVDRSWLGPLLEALAADSTVAGACSRVLPHPDADILTARDSGIDPSGSPERSVKRITDWPAYEAMPIEERRLLLNFHTVSAAIRAETMRSIPFESMVAIGEDLLWSREVVEAGMALVHEPRSQVFHSHEYSLRDWLMRNVDDGIANRDINRRELSDAEADLLVRGMIASDLAYLRDEVGLAGEELDRWAIQAALRRAAQVAGQWLGVHHSELPPAVTETFSRVVSGRRAKR